MSIRDWFAGQLTTRFDSRFDEVEALWDATKKAGTGLGLIAGGIATSNPLLVATGGLQLYKGLREVGDAIRRPVTNTPEAETEQLEQKIAAMESRIKQLESKIASSVVDPAFRSAIDKDDTSWMKNEKSLGRIAGVIPNPIIGLRERLDNDVS